ncbi:MAG: bifunctional glutamate N-acetyltransferase/amino-acid acetyltransferase ArgJ [Bacillota bacterium]|nr:bifunctional glutamate N-acetyltransferase/amino-acid acetyltransferase ArgJ [Bacillota bacterium]
MKKISGGVTAPKGFKASGVHCGLRKNKTKKDLALIVSDVLCDAAAVYTTNLVKGAPIAVTQDTLKNHKAQAIVCNSGIANTCAPDGIEKATIMAEETAKTLGISKDDIIVASTGVIGPSLNINAIISGLPEAKDCLDAGSTASNSAAHAIMTTDTIVKKVAISFLIGDKEVRIGGIAKGSGMICPNMATMLSFLTTDANIDGEILQKALSECIADTFNMVSVDGDTSTNDMVSVMASGLAGNTRITDVSSSEYKAFKNNLLFACKNLAMKVASDGEGATKLIECNVKDAPDINTAKVCAKSVIKSPLVKTAMFGADANWGRVLCALGYAGVPLNVEKIDVDFVSDAGTIPVCRGGHGVAFSEEKAKIILSEDVVIIDVCLNNGESSATAWGCDLTYDYVKINGDYRT